MFPQADAALGRRLDRFSDRPVAVAVSGGGDSLAALIATARWARGVGRPVIALSVDHQLQPQSRAWTAFAGDVALRLGARFEPLAWTAEKPAAGVPAAARAARHRLLANAARAAGAAVIVTGHTADDARENALIGQGELREWSPSPVWPEGRGVFLLRPLLALQRGAIRQELTSAGQRWIDDPANDDLNHPRIRARRSHAAAPPPARGSLARLSQAARFGDGVFRIDRAGLLAADPQQAQRLLAAAMVCAGGAERLPRKEKVMALLTRLRDARDVRATLAGARLIACDQIMIGRNAGEARRGGLARVALLAGEQAVWDGRYEITAGVDLSLRAIEGCANRLSATDRRRLLAVPALFRPALPAILTAASVGPALAPPAEIAQLSDLAEARFLGACDAIAQESELARGAHGATQSGVLCSSPVTK